MKTKLPVAARNMLRMELRNHPQNKLSSSEINLLRKDELINLAKNLGINLKTIIDNAKKNANGMEGILEEEELELYEYSEKNPAFSGNLDFELGIQMFGTEIKRKARIVWQHTPEWEYFDLGKNAVMKGCFGSIMHVEVLVEEDLYVYKTDAKGRQRKYKTKPYWKRFALFDEGIVPKELFDNIDSIIDNICREEDAKRRVSIK